MKRRSLPFLMFIKRHGDFKSRGTANGNFQRICTGKIDCTSLAPDFHTLKHATAAAAKEEREVATVDTSRIFLRTEASEDDEQIIIKLTGAAALLLVKCDESKW